MTEFAATSVCDAAASVGEEPPRARTGVRAIRVAFVVHSFDMGGLERCVARLVNHLDPDRFTPSVICLSKSGAAADWITRAGARIDELGKRRGNDPRLIGRFKNLLREQAIDIVHSHNWGTLLETVLARRWARTPVHIHAERGTVLADVNLRGVRRVVRSWIMRRALEQANQVIAVADSVQAKVAALTGYSAGRIRLISNGVDAPTCADRDSARNRLRAQLGISSSSAAFGSVGRLASVKDFPAAISATAALIGRGLDVHLILVGDGPERARLEELRAADEPLSHRIHLVGQQENIGDWLAAMDVYINCSISEGMSQSVLEAMAAGLPMVATDVGANAELVGGEAPCGLVARPRDLDSLIAEMARLAEDRGLRERLAGAAADRHHERYAVAAMVRTYEALYEQWMNARRRSA